MGSKRVICDTLKGSLGAKRLFVTPQMVLEGDLKNPGRTIKEYKVKNPLWIFKEPLSETQRTFEDGLMNPGRTIIY